MLKKILAPSTLVAGSLAGGAVASAADVTLPSTGVDVGSYTNALVTNLGTVAGTAIAAGFAIFAIWMGFKYVKKAIKGA